MIASFTGYALFTVYDIIAFEPVFSEKTPFWGRFTETCVFGAQRHR